MPAQSSRARPSWMAVALALLLFALVACTSTPASDGDFVVLESQKFT